MRATIWIQETDAAAAQRPLGSVSLVGGVAVPDESVRDFLTDHYCVEPGSCRPLTFADGAAYLAALPFNIKGTYCWAALDGEDQRIERYAALLEEHRLGEADGRPTPR